MFDLVIPFDRVTTHVAVRSGLLRDFGALLREAIGDQGGTTVMVITDEDVGDLYADTILDSLSGAVATVHEYRFPRGEGSKSLKVAEGIYAALARLEVGRDGVIVALGGGVVSDLAGFVAATWMRGIRFAICPTTVEADVDASLGGKTAVNIPGAKNLIGAFHQPTLVAVDPACLKSLDPRDVRAGVAESIKHAVLTSSEFLAWHERNVQAVLSLDGDVIAELIRNNLGIKGAVVQRDAREETGQRILLNFGHTIGHAIEIGAGFALRHGECVGLGMLAACRLSAALGMLEEGVVKRVEELLLRFGLPTGVASRIDQDQIMATIRRDKKVRGKAVRFVLLEDIGRPVVRDDVSEDLVREAYTSLCL